MQISPIGKEENHPAIQLLMLIFYAVIGVIVFVVIGFGFALVFYGFDIIKNINWLTGQDLRYVGALKIVLTAQQIGLFLVPAILLSITEGKKPWNFYGMKMPRLTWIALVFLIMFFSFPLIGFINELNQKMVLPSFLKGIENWMITKEKEGMQATIALLKGKTFGDFLINLGVIALLPAICEEFIFRGGLQRTLLRWFKNPHVAIWTVAIIFSAIHLQFFGFFTRMFLGAMFGYIYFWTGSIWYTAFAHFLNNGLFVATAWYMQTNNLPITEDAGPTMPWYAYLISAILTLALFKFLKDKTNAKDPKSTTHNLQNNS